jgi:hypothetical protein
LDQNGPVNSRPRVSAISIGASSELFLWNDKSRLFFTIAVTLGQRQPVLVGLSGNPHVFKEMGQLLELQSLWPVHEGLSGRWVEVYEVFQRNMAVQFEAGSSEFSL